jgi:Dolichyl-phosphate-mannose-protein mannosyltransferase
VRNIEAFDRRVLAVAGGVFAVLMALSSRYGFQRDEVYFLDCARHLQAGYVDQGALGPLLARVSLELFGVWLPGLRVWPALSSTATVVVGALTARELGASRRAQVLTAVGTATMPGLLGSGHIANTTAYDILAWALLALVVVRVGRTGDVRWWVPAGAVLGIGWDNNHLVGWFAIVLVVGIVLGQGQRVLLNRWFLTGAVLAGVLMAPDVWWQATHGWPSAAMTTALSARNGGALNALVWVIGQVLIVSPVLTWVWVVGLRMLWRSGNPLWRALVWAYGLTFVAFAATTGAQIYYLAGEYPCLLGAGFVALDGWLRARPRRLRDLGIATAASTLVSLPSLLPVLPPSSVRITGSTTLAETIGWPDMVRSVRAVWTALPPQQQTRAVIFTADYSEAGAINEIGRGQLPTAVSGQNNEWFWGPGNPDATTVLAVAPGPAAAGDYAVYLRRYFTDVQQVATLANPYGVHNIEWGGHLYLCTGPRLPWAQLWPQLRHYE